MRVFLFIALAFLACTLDAIHPSGNGEANLNPEDAGIFITTSQKTHIAEEMQDIDLLVKNAQESLSSLPGFAVGNGEASAEQAGEPSAVKIKLPDSPQKATVRLVTMGHGIVDMMDALRQKMKEQETKKEEDPMKTLAASVEAIKTQLTQYESMKRQLQTTLESLKDPEEEKEQEKKAKAAEKKNAQKDDEEAEAGSSGKRGDIVVEVVSQTPVRVDVQKDKGVSPASIAISPYTTPGAAQSAASVQSAAVAAPAAHTHTSSCSDDCDKADEGNVIKHGPASPNMKPAIIVPNANEGGCTEQC